MAHPTSGFYVKDDHEYVSVSSVLGATNELFNPGKIKGLEFWRRNEPDWEDIVARAQRRGKIIHAEVETTLLNTTTQGHEDEASYEEILQHNIHEYITHLAPLLELIKNENYDNGNIRKDFSLEGVLFCPHGYAGTADGRFLWEGKYTIWDWKTVRSYKEYDDEKRGKKTKPKSKYDEAFLQIGAYALANNILHKNGQAPALIKQGVICVCYDWRDPQLHILDAEQLRAAALDFVKRFAAYCELMEVAFPRPIGSIQATRQQQLVDLAL
jgi:hypothetical protein